MLISISNKKRALIIALLILLAYSMLSYSITKNITIGVITDSISGLAVIGIALLMFPLFNSNENKKMNYTYLISRIIEGILMLIGGFFILDPSLEHYRNGIYENIHIYFFISGALFFYILLYRSELIPKFISLWGIFATIILLTVTILKLFISDNLVFQILVLPIILNEFFLAAWLIIKGFNEN